MDPKRTIEELAEAIMAHLTFTQADTEFRIKTTLAAYPSELIARIDTMLDSSSRAAYFVATSIGDEASTSFVNEMLAFGPYLQTESRENASSAVKSLHRYTQLPQMADYGSAPEEVQYRCRAILTVTEALDEYHYYHGDGKLPLQYILNTKNHKDSFMLLQGGDLIGLILEQPEHATAIADIIIERKTGDTDLIREILSQNDSKALNSGII